MSFTSVFGGSTLQSAAVAYRAFSFSVNTTLVWPPLSTDPTTLASRTMDATATVPNLSLLMPPANQVSTGYDVLISNRGGNTFTVCDNNGSSIGTVVSGQSRYFQVTDNTSVGGLWNTIAFGAVTASPDAASLAGLGIGANGPQLYAKQPTTTFSAGNTIAPTDRASAQVWTGGSGTQNLPAAATVGTDFFYSIRNQGSGTLTLAANGGELIDGSSSITLQPTESAEIHAGVGNWYTVGRGRSVQFGFSLLVKAITGGTVTLSSTEAANVVQRYTGALVSNANIVLPSVVQVYYVSNQTTGAFTVTFKTAGVGSTVVVPANQNAILFCDGLNVINTATTVSGITGLLLSQGSVGAPAIGWTGDASTGIYQPASGQTALSASGVQVANFTSAGIVMAAGKALVNARFGNAANGDPLVLDWYEENTFVPGVTFGGAAVGLTYSGVRNGRFTRIGNQVTYFLKLGVSNKGSSVGAMTITGLPYNANDVWVPTVFPNGGIAPAGGGNVTAFQSGTTLIMQRYNYPSNSSTMADTDVASAFELWITGVYTI